MCAEVGQYEKWARRRDVNERFALRRRSFFIFPKTAVAHVTNSDQLKRLEGPR